MTTVRCVCGAGCAFPVPDGWQPTPPSRQVTCLDAPQRHPAGHITNSDEPLVVMTDRSGRTCEQHMCQSPVRWYVERCPLPDESYLPPVRYVCSRHVVAACTELLEARRARRRA